MTYETILVEQRDAVTLITLNRPQALNALNSQVLADLSAAFTAYDADATQRCAVLTGSGEKAFAAGADIKEMVDKPAADFSWRISFPAGRPASLPRVSPGSRRSMASPWAAGANWR